MADNKAILKAGDKEIELPILSGTAGHDVIDIRTLGANGYFTYDPGFMATGSCESSITYIDGAKGILLHRGYSIEELARDSDYIEVVYMLLHDKTPNAEEYVDFKNTITRHTLVHDQVTNFFRGFRRDAHPMAMLCGTVGAMASFYHDDLNINDPEQRLRSAYRLVAKMPTLGARC
jgi:citrate synthase